MLKVLYPILLLALAAAASAQTSATATATVHATYEASPGVRELSVLGEPYRRLVYGGDEGGVGQIASDVSAEGMYDAPNRTFDLSAQSFASVDAADYYAISQDIYQHSAYAYRFFVQLANGTDQDATVSFHMGVSLDAFGNAASPYGLLSINPDGSLTAGAFSEASLQAGVVDRSGEDVFGPLPNVRSSFATTYGYVGQSPPSPTFAATDRYDYVATYNLPRGAIHTYQIYAYSMAYADCTAAPEAVPEPASLTALGLGALALLRRLRARA